MTVLYGGIVLKNYRKFLVPFILIVLVAVGVSGLDIESVSKHDRVSENDTRNITITAESTNNPDGVKDTGTEVSKNGTDVSESKPQQSKTPDINQNGSDKDKNSSSLKTDNKNNKDNKKKKSKNKSDKKTDSENKKSNSKSTEKSAAKNDKKPSDKNVKSKNGTDGNKNTNTSKSKSTPLPDNKDKTSADGSDDNAEYIKCSISINCSILLSNMDKLDKNAGKYVPQDGKLLDKVELKVKKGASVYDVLTAACKRNKIAYDAEYSAIYKTSYVKGIGYLYEKMAGDMSGWLYQVDGVTPNVGASAYKLKGGESIEWMYTCSGRAGS